jgi:hypothetical protein
VSCELQCHVEWPKFTVSEIRTDSIIKVIGHHPRDGGSTSVNLYQSTWCYNPEDSHL